MSETPSDLGRETRIGDYILREKLGAGGFGAVYRALQSSINREVAIKVILEQFSNQPEFIANFEAEAQLIARLEHPHVVPLYDFWREQAGAYLVMRLLRGGSLRHKLVTQGAIDLDTTARILDEVTHALATAHRSGIVHRDLKPDNVLLDEQGNSYLADFGIAKPIGHITMQEGISGSIPYMAPEQLMGEPPDPAADIYSLGIMLYEMLTGQHPFKDASVTQMILKHIHEPIPPLDEVPAQLKPELNDLLYRITAKSPGERPQEVIDIATRFREIVNPNVPLGASVVITPPISEQRKLLQQHIDLLYRQIHELYDETSSGLDTERQSQVGQLQKQIEYRVTGLNKIVQYVVPELPQILMVPPAPPYALVGITELFTQAKALLLADTSLTLLGPTGVGKTELAAALAHDPAIVEHFNSQIVWFPMNKEANILSLLGEWLLAYNVDASELAHLSSIEARRKRLYEVLPPQPTLVIVDNLWSVAQLQNALGLNSTTLVVIVTTRLNDAAANLFWQVLRMEALPVVERKILLTQLASELDPDDGQLEQLALKIGGLPRDLILASRRLRRASSPSRLSREVDKLINMPIGVFDQGFAGIQLSVDEVSEAAKHTLRVLAELPAEPNSLSETALEVIFDNLDTADELVDASLLKLDSDRYALHPSFSEYARTYLPLPDDAITRIVTYFVGFAQEHRGDYPRLTLESSNITTALNLAQHTHHHRMLSEGVIAMYPFWNTRGLIEQSKHFLPLALQAAQTAQHRAYLHYAQAILAYNQGDVTESLAQLAACLREADLMPDDDDVALTDIRLQALTQQIAIKIDQRQFDDARTMLTMAETWAQQSGNSNILGNIYNQRAGVALLGDGDVTKARTYWLQALDSARRAGDLPDISKFLQNLGLFEVQSLHFIEAQRYLDESLEIARGLGHMPRIAGVLQNRGNLELSKGNLEQARLYFEEALQKARLSHDSGIIGWSLLTLANVLASLGQFVTAEKYLSESFGMAHKAENHYLAVNVVHVLCKVGELRIVHSQRDLDTAAYTQVASGSQAMGLDKTAQNVLADLIARLQTHPDNLNLEVAQAHYRLALIEGREFNEPIRAREHLAACLNLISQQDTTALYVNTLLEDAEIASKLGEWAAVNQRLQALSIDTLTTIGHAEQVEALLQRLPDPLSLDASITTRLNETIYRLKRT